MAKNTILIVETSPRLVAEERPYTLTLDLATVVTQATRLSSPNGTVWVQTIDNDGNTYWTAEP